MDSFPFSKRRLLALPIRRQHKWIKRWIREFYDATISQTISIQSLNTFLSDYNRVRGWLGEPSVCFSGGDDLIHWGEFIADQYHEHQKRMGVGIREADFLPKVITGDLKTDQPWKPALNYRVALDNFRSAFNVGSIFRTSDAAGFHSVILGGKTPATDHNQVRKTSMGTVEWIPEVARQDLAKYLSHCEVPVIGVETVENAENYQVFDWPESAVLVLGNEEYGLSREVMAECDYFVRIPMCGRKNSVNVANAFAVIAFHIHAHQLAEKG